MILRSLLGRINNRPNDDRRQVARVSRTTRHARPGLDRLDDRLLLAAGISAALDAAGTLTVKGTSGSDTIEVYRQQTPFGSDDVLNPQIVVRGVGTFDAQRVKAISIKGMAGDDTVRVESNLKSITSVDGGTGKDRVEYSSGSDIAYGSVTLDNQGVLRINGTSQADRINVDELFGTIWVEGVGGFPLSVFDASKVKSIVIDGREGDDSIFVSVNANLVAHTDVDGGLGKDSISVTESPSWILTSTEIDVDTTYLVTITGMTSTELQGYLPSEYATPPSNTMVYSDGSTVVIISLDPDFWSNIT
ncbi:hypothetical protein [Aquisphaera insulae]|uniref:hypothetical protein n=1 Tax=Aquisphaera insulae TaxID=2712864 RepID=UPI0013EDE81F|nr:hypothetical protein [Aquisphaera insulae]